MKFLAIYLMIINLAAFAAMGLDKQQARNYGWRIPERVLFLLAILGGSIGAVVGMWSFRHKTRHWYFVIGMPAILVIQLALSWILKP